MNNIISCSINERSWEHPIDSDNLQKKNMAESKIHISMARLLSTHNIKSSISNTHRLRKRSGFGTVIQRNNPFMENVNATDSSNNSSKNCSPCCYPPKRTKIRHWKNEVQEKGSSVFKHGESSLFSLKRILPYENGDQNLKFPITGIYNVKLCNRRRPADSIYLIARRRKL